MRAGYVGIDLAIAKNKYLPVAVCTWEQGRLIPQPLRRLSLTPPKGRGNAATLDGASVRQFAREAATYVNHFQQIDAIRQSYRNDVE
jgi:hypothetical protein